MPDLAHNSAKNAPKAFDETKNAGNVPRERRGYKTGVGAEPEAVHPTQEEEQQQMKKLLLATAAATMALGFATGAMAQSSKFSAMVTGVLVTNGAGGAGQLSMPIKTGNKADLLVGVSLQSTVLTETKTKGKGGEINTATAEGTVTVCLFVDNSNTKLAPNCVVFESRRQELTTKLGGVVTCPTTDTTDVDDFCTVSDFEEVNLLIKTMSANHFNFVVRDLPAGEHTVRAEIGATTSVVPCSTGATADSDEFCNAEVAVGPGSITIEQVRAINNDDNTGGIIFN